MLTIREIGEFSKWLNGLVDQHAKAKIDIRIRRQSLGNPGDVRPVGDGVSEPKVAYGPGYRVYFMRENLEVVLLLCGGDKRSQDRDIERAKVLAGEVRTIAKKAR
jgi:putative addiction module killer protein